MLTPKERFQKHLAGEKANRFVRDYGVRLKPRLYGRYNPMATRAEAVEKEELLAKRLRLRGVVGLNLLQTTPCVFCENAYPTH